MPTNDFVDHDENALEEGQLVIWARTIGRSAALQKALITGFTPKMVKLSYFYWQHYYVMEDAPPNRFGHSFKRFTLDSNGKKIKDPRRPSELKGSTSTVKPGSTLLIWQGEEWPEVTEARRLGLLDEI